MTMWWEQDPDLKSTYESFRARMSERFGDDPQVLADFDASVSLVTGMTVGLAMRNAPAAQLPTDIQQAFTLVGRLSAHAEKVVHGRGDNADDPEWREALARLGAHSLMASGMAFHEELGKAIGEEPATPPDPS